MPHLFGLVSTTARDAKKRAGTLMQLYSYALLATRSFVIVSHPPCLVVVPSTQVFMVCGQAVMTTILFLSIGRGEVVTRSFLHTCGLVVL